MRFPLVLSACFVYVAYSLVEEVSGIDLSEDTFFVIESIIFAGVAVWGVATTIGVWRLRRWGRNSALWLSCAVFLVYLPNVVRYAYLVKTSHDVGWSWEILYPLVPLFREEVQCMVARIQCRSVMVAGFDSVRGHPNRRRWRNRLSSVCVLRR